jgi:ABC-type lipoprotein export system ATPase subunit
MSRTGKEGTEMATSAADHRAEQAVLVAEGCSKVYGSGASVVTALTDVSLALARGELVALVGPSGSGKSTLLSILGALLTPSSGTVRVNGVEVTALNEAARTRLRATTYGLVFQSAGLVPFLTARENVELAATFAGLPGRRAAERSRELLGELGLADRADHRPSQLSGGEQQRVALARALISDPQVLLADEPTAHLDGDRGAQVVEALAAAVHRDGRAGLVVTHDQRVAERADRVLQIVDGRLV